MQPDFSDDFMKNGNTGDTTLRLDGFGYGVKQMATFGTGIGPCKNGTEDGCRLVLGLGPTPCAYSDEYSPLLRGQTKELASILNRELPSRRDSVLKLGLSGGVGVVSNVLEFSASTRSPFDATCLPDHWPVDGNRFVVPVGDEGSTSAKRSGGYMKTLVLAPRMAPKHTMSAISESGSVTVSSDSKGNNMKSCKFSGCKKGSRGATGLCIGHGGGQRCQKPGCNRGAESRTPYCKSHGGGKRCQHLGCTKSAEGKTDHCIAHGGGRRCGFPSGCTKAARGKSGLCIKHGGGKRCKVENCTRSAEGQIGLCISHGGGRRCQFIDCCKGAQGSTMFCKAHGGGKRCIFTGCTKGAEGSTPLCKGHGGGKRCLFDGGGICPKSVHGGTDFCVAHGGGKRCAVPSCGKSARGRTDCCVKHGGGKRCKIEKCDKSAQGSTEFCKGHGGGMRCRWGDGKCQKFARGKNGLCAAHCSLVLGGDRQRDGRIDVGLFRGLVTSKGSSDKTCSSSGMSVLSDSSDSFERPFGRQPLIPPQVLVPLSMKGESSYSKPSESENREGRRAGVGVGDSGAGKSCDFVVPEGRVHGGGLLSLLGGSLSNAVDGI